MATILVSMNTSTSFAQNNALSQSGNSKAEQAIEQARSSSQDSQCVSGDITALSCNNIGLQVQKNSNEDEKDDDTDGEVPPGTPGSTVICHHPPGNPDNSRTISVGSEAAVQVHLNHGDTRGPCPT